MLSIYEQENALFERWMEHEKWIHKDGGKGMSDLAVEQVFCYDGLHFTGQASDPQPNPDGSFWRVMKRDYMEEELWNKAYLKPVFLCKDHNSQGDTMGVDVREETGYANEKFYRFFYANYLCLLYGLTNYDHITNEFPAFDEASSLENYWDGEKGFFHAPVVRINLKKTMGASSCPNYLLQRYIDRDKNLIKEQIRIYKGANVFVCCNGTEPKEKNPVLNLLKEWFDDLEHYRSEPSEYIWYSVKYKVIVIWEYHMSTPGVSKEEYYRCIPYLQQFLEEHKGFLD